MSDGAGASASAQPEPHPSTGPRTVGDMRRRLLRHYLPLAVASAAAMVLLMNVAFFDANRYPPPMEIMTEGISGAFPGEGTQMGRGMHGPEQSGASLTDQAEAPDGESPADTATMQHGGDPNAADEPTTTVAESDSGVHVPPMQHGGDPNSSDPAATTEAESGDVSSVPPVETGGGPDGGGQTRAGQGRVAGQDPMDMIPGDSELLMRRYATATGYVGLVLLGLTLLIGPANLVRGKRAPLSSYLARDVGIWAAAFSVLHVVYGFLTQHTDGILSYFLAPDDRGRILTTSFGLANWAGIAATVIVVALAAISSDATLRKLKFRRWKQIQRLNYALFPLVIMHALLYGALKRLTSPYTALLIVSVIAVGVGQAVGVRLWRQRKTRNAATNAAAP